MRENLLKGYSFHWQQQYTACMSYQDQPISSISLFMMDKDRVGMLSGKSAEPKIIQIMNVDQTNQSHPLQKCIEDLQAINECLLSNPKPQSLEKASQEVSGVIQELWFYKRTVQINEESYRDSEQRLRKLEQRQDNLEGQYSDVLTNIEILLYQKQYETLKQRLNEYKRTPLHQTQRSKGLNTAFIEPNTQSVAELFDLRPPTTPTHSQYHEEVFTSMSKEDIENAMGEAPKGQNRKGHRRQDVWLEMGPTDKTSRKSQFEQVLRTNKKTHQKGNTSERALLSSRTADMPIRTGKKMSSMVLLKEKSTQKTRGTKTSTKKKAKPERENAEGDRFRKRLFSTKSEEGKGKGRIRKQNSALAVK